jgi:membrane protease YdiL (CAAX protease family)
VLALVVFELLVSMWINIAHRNPATSNWLMTHAYALQNALKVFRAGVWLCVAYWFSGLGSYREFSERAGLSQRPDVWGWLGALAALGIAFLHHYGVKEGWTSPSIATKGFVGAGGVTLLFYVGFIITLGPFFEETVLRGFLYQCFRGTFGMVLSTLLILCVTAYFHMDALAHGLWTVFCFTLLGILVCAIKERTGNVWNCVLCHATYNAAGTVTWPFYVSGLVLLLILCAPQKVLTRPSEPN